MKLPIIGPIVDFLSTMGRGYIDLKKTEMDGKIMVAGAKAKSQATVLVSNAQSINEWERTQAANADKSWKDEFWTLLIAAPLPFVFVPATRDFIIDGFAALHMVPEWYLWAIAASISASFGIRTGLFEKIGKVAAPKGGK